jgi:hypothetical protein
MNTVLGHAGVVKCLACVHCQLPVALPTQPVPCKPLAYHISQWPCVICICTWWISVNASLDVGPSSPSLQPACAPHPEACSCIRTVAAAIGCAVYCFSIASDSLNNGCSCCSSWDQGQC